MSNARVVVYIKADCAYSRAAQDLLKQQHIPFETVDVTHDQEMRDELAERTHGRRTVPVVFIDDQPIGGFQELASLVRRGKLEEIVRAA
jgi:GrxC family glutaredoxin